MKSIRKEYDCPTVHLNAPTLSLCHTSFFSKYPGLSGLLMKSLFLVCGAWSDFIARKRIFGDTSIHFHSASAELVGSCTTDRVSESNLTPSLLKLVSIFGR